MIGPRTREGWRKPSVAALLLVLQALGSPLAAVAHAREPGGVPTAIEARHVATCTVLHNELTCTLCQYAGTLVVTRPTEPQSDLGRVASIAVVPDTRRRPVDRPALGTSPRAPPAPLS
ncbi:MAG TPA: hypothetical protein VMC86_12925 [Gemmatimonadales bacterium]|nr:hypothetical protein [Gemmatimonadales bacterium]